MAQHILEGFFNLLQFFLGNRLSFAGKGGMAGIGIHRPNGCGSQRYVVGLPFKSGNHWKDHLITHEVQIKHSTVTLRGLSRRTIIAQAGVRKI